MYECAYCIAVASKLTIQRSLNTALTAPLCGPRRVCGEVLLVCVAVVMHANNLRRHDDMLRQLNRFQRTSLRFWFRPAQRQLHPKALLLRLTHVQQQQHLAPPDHLERNRQFSPYGAVLSSLEPPFLHSLPLIAYSTRAAVWSQLPSSVLSSSVSVCKAQCPKRPRYGYDEVSEECGN